MPALLDAIPQDSTVAWEIADDRAHAQLDRHRITEDAAEAISLALAREALSWVIERRGQRGDHADWFMRDPDDHAVAFEVSGIDAGDHEARLRSKLGQVGRSLADRRAACVVELATPRAALATEARAA